MRTEQGGTKKWCPHCEETTVCKAVNPSTLGYESGQRWYRTKHTDVIWFRRGLICQECASEWLTAEIEESFLDELIALRDALKDVKDHAEQYIEESSKASKALGSLTKSLNVLKTLKVYKSK